MKLYEYAAYVERVVDGDSYELDMDMGCDIHWKTKIRMFGIDTPECRTSDLLQKEAGLLVKQYMIDMIENKTIYVESKEYEKEKYGSILGCIYITDKDGEQSINDHLVEKGFARPYIGWTKPVWDREFLKNIIQNLKETTDEI